MASSTAQINVRLDRALKAAGDEALMEEGISPSEAVRALWSKLAKRGKTLEAIKQLLFSPEQTVLDTAGQSPLEAGWHIADEFYATFETSSGQNMRDMAWQDLYAEAMDEHYTSKGLYE